MHMLLKAHRFRKKGSTFERDGDGVIQVIQLQKSTSSNRDAIKATVNLCVYSTVIGEKLGFDRPNLLVRDPHWYQRIGLAGPWESDKWWEAATEEQAQAAALEIVQALETYGLSALDQVATTDQLKNLWLSGNSSGGLSEKTRQLHLRCLKS